MAQGTVTVSRRQLLRAAKLHKYAYERMMGAARRERRRHLKASAYLLLFYAVECAIKAKLLEQRGCESYDHLQPHEQISHQLNRGLALLRVNVSIPSACLEDRPGRLRDHELHQAWRYGCPLREQDEQHVVKALERAMNILLQL